MKYAKYAVIVLALALVMGFTAAPAAAQERFVGSFSLSTPAYFGQTLLQPGDYKILVSIDWRSGAHPVEVRSEGFRTFILTGASMNQPVSDRSFLQVERINGVDVIRGLDAGSAGRSFRFVVAKKVHATSEAASAKMTIPVTAD